MKLYKLNDGKLEQNTKTDFKLEKEIQQLVETNLKTLFDLEFVKSELKYKNTRFDTLCFDQHTKSFVIIEYKNGTNYSLIDQGYTYLSLLLNNKAEFVLTYNEITNQSLKKDDIDWSQTRIIFISPEFSFYQKTSINFKNLPFELYEIFQFENQIGIKKVSVDSDVEISSSTNSKKSNVVSKVSGEIQKYDENYHLYKSKSRPENVIQLYKELKQRLIEIDQNIEVKYGKQTIGFRQNRVFVDLIIYNKGIIVHPNLKIGQLLDPYNLAEDVSKKGHWGNGDYKIYFKKIDDINKVFDLIMQAFEKQKW